MAECKTGSKKLTRGQENFRREWPGIVIVARDPDQAVKEFFTALATDRLGKV